MVALDDVCGLYTDTNACAVFVVPVSWSSKQTLKFRAHGADAGTWDDWVAQGELDTSTAVCTMQDGSDDVGTFTEKGILWKGKGVWKKIHILNAQLAALRRPPFLLSVFVICLVLGFADGAFRMVRRMAGKVWNKVS